MVKSEHTKMSIENTEVLLIDDQRITSGAVEAHLNTYNVKVKRLDTLDEVLNKRPSLEGVQLVLINFSSQPSLTTQGLRDLVNAFPNSPVGVFSAPLSMPVMQNYLEAGLRGYIPKTASLDVLVQALTLMSQGGAYIPEDIVVGARRKSNTRGLTHSEIEVLELLAVGFSNKEIASALALTEANVKMRVRSVAVKFGVRNRTEIVLAAIRSGLAEVA